MIVPPDPLAGILIVRQAVIPEVERVSSKVRSNSSGEGVLDLLIWGHVILSFYRPVWPSIQDG